ncbi:MAG: GNAT family N-acetyltransferase [Chlorobi bacterium]|nr:GNAT family N-acetyltransferase [Chlorobiota bacterium]
MKNEHCEIIPAVIENFDDYYEIRSEKKNLFWTGYDAPPDYERFFEWYKKRLADNKRDLYLVYCDNVCSGSLNIDYYEDHAMIGYSVKEAFEGQGLGTYIVKCAIDIIKKREELKYIGAWINEKNKGSIKVITKNNFYKTDTKEVRLRFGQEELFYKYQYDI